MTTLPILSLSGSLATGAPSSPTSSDGAVVIYREFSPIRAVAPKDTRPVDSLVSKYSADPSRAAMLAEARASIANELYGEAVSLAALRLRAGLSQSQLAERAGTSQPHIARIERGQNDPSTDLVVRIADALGVSAGQAFDGVRAHRHCNEAGAT